MHLTYTGWLIGHLR